MFGLFASRAYFVSRRALDCCDFQLKHALGVMSVYPVHIFTGWLCSKSSEVNRNAVPKSHCTYCTWATQSYAYFVFFINCTQYK